MPEPKTDQPFGDDGFEPSRKRGWFGTVSSVLFRAVTGVFAGMSGKQWPRQLPLDPPPNRENYRP